MTAKITNEIQLDNQTRCDEFSNAIYSHQIWLFIPPPTPTTHFDRSKQPPLGGAAFRRSIKQPTRTDLGNKPLRISIQTFKIYKYI